MAALKLHQVQEERRASVASPASNAEHAAVVTAAPVTVVSGSGESCTVVGRQRAALVHHHQDLLERVDKFRNQGSVLTRGTLLKRDHFPRGTLPQLRICVHARGELN